MNKLRLQAIHDLIRLMWERPLLSSIAGPNSESRHPCAATPSADWRITLAISLALACLAIFSAHTRASALSPVIYYDHGYGFDIKSGPVTQDILFDSDVAKIFQIMTNRFDNRHGHTSQHPLMSLILYLPTSALRSVGLSEIQAVRSVTVLTFGLWSSLLFWLLIIWGCRPTDAVVFNVLGQVSAGAMFWSSVPETFALGSASMIVALIITIWPKRMNPLVRYTLAISISISMTVTNVMVGLLAAARRLSGRDLLIAGASAWLIVTVLWVVQKGLFPFAAYFLPRGSFIYDFLGQLGAGRLGQVLQTLLCHAVVMPDIHLISGSELHAGRFPSAERVMSVQRSVVGSGSFAGAVATMAWIGLAGLGAWAAWVARSGMSQLCLLVLGGQVALHILFGPETFLYTMHVLPLLIVLVAATAFTRLRPAGLALAAIVIVAAGTNNWAQFNKAVAVVQELDAYARTFPNARP